MERVRDKVKQGAEEAARILDEYKHRLTLAIEEEGEEIRNQNSRGSGGDKKPG